MMEMPAFDFQPTHLQDALVRLQPLAAADFERLYAVAADPLIWEQHPNPDRYQRSVFAKYFEGALASKGAFLVLDAVTDTPIGCSRYYDHDPQARSVLIGYTFLARSHWGTPANRSMKALMLHHAFAHVDTVYFHIGAHNIRSQKAIAKIGALKVGEEEVAYYGESPKLNFIYAIEGINWHACRGVEK